MLGWIEIDSFILTSVHPEIRLLIPNDIEALQSHAALNRRFPNGRQDGSPGSFELARAANVQRKKLHQDFR